MRKKIVRRVALSLVAVLVIVYFATGTFQKEVAVKAAYIHAYTHYWDKGFTFVSVEYRSVFGDYQVTFADKNGWLGRVTLFPSFFPIIVDWDFYEEGRG